MRFTPAVLFAAGVALAGAMAATPAAAFPAVSDAPSVVSPTPGVEQARVVCGPYRCWRQPGPNYFYGPRPYYGPRPWRHPHPYWGPRRHYW